jgi:hypothetical protein
MSVRFMHNVLVPGWIGMVGVGSLSLPPLGVGASLALFMVGVVVIPALVLIASAFRRGAPASGALGPTASV